MRPWLRWTILASALIAAPALAREELAVSAAQQAASGIRTERPAVAGDRLDTRLPARVAVPNDRLRVVGARVPGIVATLTVGEGEPVTAGQTLAELQSPELAALQSEHLAAMSRFALADAAMKRDRELHDLGIIARRRFEDTEAQWREAQVALDHSRTRLTLAGVDPRQIQVLERTRRSTGTLAVTAPISGVVLTQSVSSGQQVTLDSPLYTLADLKVLWLEIHAPQAIAARVRLGDPVRVDNGAVTGEVIAVGRQIHETDQGVLLRARVVPGETVLLPGQFVEVALGVKSRVGNLHEVPAAALAYLDGAAHVFVQTPTGFRAVPVTVVSENGERRIIQGAVSANEPVAVAGVAALKALASGIGGGQ